MRRIILLAGFVLLLSAIFTGSALGGPGGTDLPLKGSYSGLSTIDLVTGDVDVNWTGNTTLLGRNTVTADGSVISTGPNTFDFSSTWTIMTASGDEITGSCEGGGTIDETGDTTLELECTFDSFEGRFEGVTADFDLTIESTFLSSDGTTANYQDEATEAGLVSLNLNL